MKNSEMRLYCDGNEANNSKACLKDAQIESSIKMGGSLQTLLPGRSTSQSYTKTILQQELSP